MIKLPFLLYLHSLRGSKKQQETIPQKYMASSYILNVYFGSFVKKDLGSLLKCSKLFLVISNKTKDLDNELNREKSVSINNLSFNPFPPHSTILDLCGPNDAAF